MPESRQQQVRFYVKLALGTICFFAFLYYTHISITNPAIMVDRWIFIMLIAVMGSLLGIDMLDQYRGASNNDNSNDGRNHYSRPSGNQTSGNRDDGGNRRN